MKVIIITADFQEEHRGPKLKKKVKKEIKRLKKESKINEKGDVKAI